MAVDLAGNNGWKNIVEALKEIMIDGYDNTFPDLVCFAHPFPSS